MADGLTAIPASVLRNLADKLYEKRKNAALEVAMRVILCVFLVRFCVMMDLMWQVEGVVKQLTAVGDHDRITAVINLLTNEFTYSPQANHRKVCFVISDSFALVFWMFW